MGVLQQNIQTRVVGMEMKREKSKISLNRNMEREADVNFHVNTVIAESHLQK